jgi:cytochrome c oxidase subunit 3
MSSVIPYTSEPRPDTGVHNVKLGIWLFLSSEVMLFGSLFAAYILLRTGNPNWGVGQEALSVPMATFNTIVLIGSSVTMVLAWAAAMERRFGRFRLFMGATVLLGGVFMVVKYFEYTAKFEHGLFPATSTFLAVYFTFTGLHALHVLAGMTYNAYLWGPGAKMYESDPLQFANRVEASGLFWHFVDLVWIFLFPVLYLLHTKGGGAAAH